MPQRGEVLAVRRRLGFAAEGRVEYFAVLQSDLVHDVLASTIVVPLDDALPFYADDPLAIPLTAREAGTRKPQVALVAHLTSVSVDRFELDAVGRLKPATVRALESAARVLLDLP